MNQPRVIARLMLLVVALLALLAAPMAFADPIAMSSAGGVLSAAVEGQTAFTPEYSAGHVARPQAVLAGDEAILGEVVISEFRSRGGDGGDEFIELFNRSDHQVTLTGWTLYRSDDCDSVVAEITGALAGSITLEAGEHYLVGGQSYSEATTPDSSPVGGIGIGDESGIALFDGSNVPMDQVGMCDDTLYKEGTVLAAFPNQVGTSYERMPGGSSGSCTDLNDNSADFQLITPSDPQGSDSADTPCPAATATPTNTATNTPTNTPTATNTPICSAVPITPLLVLINEVAWYGTPYRNDHYWVELFNTNTSCDVNLNGWRLVGIRQAIQQFQVSFDSDDFIPAGGFLVLTRLDGTFHSSLDPGVEMRTDGNLLLGQVGQCLQLRGPTDGQIDTANNSTGCNLNWPAGSTAAPRRSMERYRPTLDTPTNWVTFYRPPSFPEIPLPWPRDGDNDPAAGNLIYGTPGRTNWALGVTITPSPIPTRFRTPTPRPPTPFAHMLINEFLPRAGSDWNGDGQVNVYDEFIEIKNNGPIDGDLAGWKLDDVADGGSPPFTLPSLVLKPGERAVFYGLQTRILLDDSGDTVRLLDARGIVIDARGYGVIEKLDISHCRIPDGYYWRIACFPTPGNENALTGVVPATAPILLSAPPPCLLADTVPAPFLEAECNGFGSDVYDRLYWEPRKDPALILVERDHKWKTIYQ